MLSTHFTRLGCASARVAFLPVPGVGLGKNRGFASSALCGAKPSESLRLSGFALEHLKEREDV